MDTDFSSFRCSACHTEIQASADMAGLETECPACGARIVIPSPETDGVVRHEAGDVDPETLEAMKRRTIRIELEDL